ncbi:hypothetical protein Nmel_010763 [Mimus melanotis]
MDKRNLVRVVQGSVFCMWSATQLSCKVTPSQNPVNLL